MKVNVECWTDNRWQYKATENGSRKKAYFLCPETDYRLIFQLFQQRSAENKNCYSKHAQLRKSQNCPRKVQADQENDRMRELVHFWRTAKWLSDAHVDHDHELQVCDAATQYGYWQDFNRIITSKSILNTALQIGFFIEVCFRTLKQAFLLRKMILKARTITKFCNQ